MTCSQPTGIDTPRHARGRQLSLLISRLPFGEPAERKELKLQYGIDDLGGEIALATDSTGGREVRLQPALRQKNMHIAQIAEGVRNLLLHTKPETFIYDLLTVYGKPKASVTRLQAGEYNISKDKDYVLWKSNVYFTHTGNHPPAQILEQMKQADPVKKHKPRFIISTNFDKFCAYDTKSEETLDIAFVELASKFDFFLPWAGMEKSKQTQDSPADVKAAEKMAKLYDLILEQNPVQNDEQRHNLNVFLSRLLFCYFAEDTTIFEAKLFSKSIESHTSADGSDLAEYLQGLFKVLDEESRDGTPSYYEKFPYVNGGLFENHVPVPAFNKRSRELLIRCGLDLDWSEINPDIFGSMFQAVVDVEQRGNMGMHYTSYQNIMKVAGPLFLDALHEDLITYRGNAKKLEDLLSRLTKIKVFDPACGSGNFLIITYKELRKLEMEILEALAALNQQHAFSLSGIRLSQFYGIELDDFASEIATLALWLAEHQMNVIFYAKFKTTSPTLPLKPSGNVKCGNAARTSWQSVCPANKDEEIYVLGNPPYLGARQQSSDQKTDVELSFSKIQGSGDLDYIAVWFMKAAEYAEKTNVRFAFVSTSSLTQGVQVAILWPLIFGKGLEIFFCHLSFKWENNAKKNAAVICVIVGLRHASQEDKFIFDDGLRKKAKNINAYLADAENLFIYPRKTGLSALPPINYGSFALDDGNYTLTATEAKAIQQECPTSSKFLRPFIGARELLHGEERYCLWLKDDLEEALKCRPIRMRYEKVKTWRSNSDRATTKKLSATSHLFAEIRQPTQNYLAVPTVSSERRKYLPIEFLQSEVVASNQIYVVPNATPIVFGLLASRFHMIWIEAVGGKLKNDYRYSSALLYNNFPVPVLNDSTKKKLTVAVGKILTVRESYSEMTLAKLYDPDLMPPELLDAHLELDSVVESAYGLTGDVTDEDRLTAIFKLYTKMTKGTIHA